MSVYKEIKTEFKNPTSLLSALSDLDVNIECVNPTQNVSPLVSHWHNQDPRMVAIAIQRENARRANLGHFDGLGFRWNGTGYEVVQDTSDTGNAQIVTQMNALKQRYAFHEVSRQARARGYTVQEIKDGNVVRLTLRKR